MVDVDDELEDLDDEHDQADVDHMTALQLDRERVRLQRRLIKQLKRQSTASELQTQQLREIKYYALATLAVVTGGGTINFLRAPPAIITHAFAWLLQGL